MRNKPTIIAFKTPSLENCEKRDSSNSMGEHGWFKINLRFNNFLIKFQPQQSTPTKKRKKEKSTIKP